MGLQRSFSARHWEELLRVLACSDMTLRQVVQRWPGIGDVSVAEVMNRLLCLKVPHWDPQLDAHIYVNIIR